MARGVLLPANHQVQQSKPQLPQNLRNPARTQQWVTNSLPVILLFVFVALRPKSTAMVIAGRSVHLTTLFPGQA